MFKIRENIRAISPYVPGKPVKEVERELGIKNSIKLASNENAWGFSPKAKRAMEEAIKEANIYPDGNSFYLRKKLAELNNVSIDEVIVGNGSNEVLEIIMRIGLDDKANVVSSEHAFAVYKIVTELCGAKFRGTKAKDHAFDIKAIMEACDEHTSMIIIDNPNNPTGTHLPYDQMLEVLEFAKKNKIMFLADEAYTEYIRAKDYRSMTSLFGKYDNLVVTRTLSKAYGLCGLRVGYGIAHREIIEMANKVREPFNVNIVAQHAALASLDDQNFVKEVVKRTHEGIDYLKAELKEIGLRTLPTQCNFLLVEVPEDGGVFFNKLLQFGIIVRPVGNYGLKNYVRITVGTMEQNKKTIEAIKELLK